MTTPTITDYSTGGNGGGATVTLTNPAGARQGDQMLAWMSADGNNVSITALSGWTQLLDVTFNTRRCYLLVRQHADSYPALTLSGTRGMSWTVLAVRGAKSTPTLGDTWRRVDHGGSIMTTECPSVLSQPAESLAIALVSETSTGSETEDQITYTGVGWDKYLYWDSNPSDNAAPNHWLGKRALPVAGDTGLVTTTWPNASNNSVGVQVVYESAGNIPTIVGSVAAGNPSPHVLTFNLSGLDIQPGDILLGALRSQSATSPADWQSAGWVRAFPDFPGASTPWRITGFYWCENPTALGPTVTFTGPTGSNDRAAGVLILIRGTGSPVRIDSTGASSEGISITNGKRCATWNTIHANTLVLWFGAAEVTAGTSSAPTTTPGTGTLVNWFSAPSASSSISRTVVRVDSHVQLGAGATGPADYAWDGSPSSPVAIGIALWAPIHRAVTAGISFALETSSDDSKNASASSEFSFMLGTSGQEAKAGATDSAVTLALSVLAEAAKAARISSPLGVGLDVQASLSKTARTASIIEMALNLDGWEVKHGVADASFEMLLSTTAQGAKRSLAEAAFDLLLTLSAIVDIPPPHSQTPESRTICIDWQDRTVCIDWQDRTICIE